MIRATIKLLGVMELSWRIGLMLMLYNRIDTFEFLYTSREYQYLLVALLSLIKLTPIYCFECA